YAVRRGRCGNKREWADVEPLGTDGRTVRRLDLVEQSPPLEPRNTRLMDVVNRDGVTRERSTIHEQHPISLPSKQHRRRRSPTARSHYDRVVHDTLLTSLEAVSYSSREHRRRYTRFGTC